MDDYGRPKNGDFGPFKRPLSTAEWEFINNERLVCKFDYLHFFLNYCSSKIITDYTDPRHNTVSRIGSLLASQQLLHDKISKREEEIAAAMLRREPVDGILIAGNKARQLGFTVYFRGATWHRLLFWADTGAAAASVDDPMTQEIYDKDKVIFDNLPWWLKPEVLYDTKGKQLKFANLNTSINYFQANQKGGMGTGQTLNVVHLTELGLWEKQAGKESVDKIRLDLLPAIPQGPLTLVGLESTAKGRGNYWHNLIMESWEGRTRFIVFFCPFYAEPRKHRRAVPEGWEPKEVTKGLMKRVEETSPLYMNGKTVRLSPEQACWWEFAYEEARKDGTLADHLSNHPATLEESFQHSGAKAFGIESMQWVWDQVGAGIPYELQGRKVA